MQSKPISLKHMLNDIKLHSKWALITIDDEPDSLPGNLVKIIRLISDTIQPRYVILNDIEGCGEWGLVRSFQEREGEVLLLEDFCQKVLGVEQFDWGDFFLFKEYPEDWEDSEENYYPPLIAQTDTTVRAIDDQFFYVYTIYQEVIDVITKNYEIESIKTDFLKNLDYPY